MEEALRRRACTQIVVAHRLRTLRNADLIAAAEGAYARLLAEGEEG